jgi:ABC-type glutathione transport system ATPase component
MTAAAGAGASGYAIRTEDLRKTYKSSRGDVPAVRGIDLSVGAGQFFGLLGPNGAGKSTTIGMLTTLILPTGGHAWVSGLDVVANPVGVKRRIGVVTQNNTLDMQLTVAENLEFRSRFFGLSLREASGWPTGARRCPPTCPADRPGGCSSPGPWCTGRTCCSSTSRPPAWTRRPG